MAGTVKVFYCKQTEVLSDSNRLSPAPTVSINPEIYYVNDTVIGYTYNVTVDGYCTSLESSNELLEGNLDQVEFVRKIFNVNGGNLYVTDDNDTNIIVCKGATIRGVNFSESPNYALNYIPYSINIEFNEIDFPGCSNNPDIPCTSSLFHLNQTSQNITSDNLVDIKKYKIRSFSDQWNFSIDNDIYKQYVNANNSVENNIFKVTYQIDATGKNYYVDDTLVPAWHQAREFVQDRLYTQVKGLLTGVQTLEPGDSRDGCNATRTANELYEVSRGSGLIGGFNTTVEAAAGLGAINTEVYDETISCNCSESDGTFSVTYSAIIKRGTAPYLNSDMATHTYTFTHSYNRGDFKEATISVQGEVQGMIRGGYIWHNERFSLPQNGSFIFNVDGSGDRYNNARAYYYNRVGGNTDINNGLKTLVGVNATNLLVSGGGTYISPQSFVLDHDYSGGKIGYNATYTTAQARAVANGFSNISVTRKDSVEVIQEFVIPGRSQGPIIQRLGMYTPRTVSISIDAVFPRNSPVNQQCSIGAASICSYFPGLPADIQNIINTDENQAQGWICTSKRINSSLIDGSISINLEFTCTG